MGERSRRSTVRSSRVELTARLTSPSASSSSTERASSRVRACTSSNRRTFSIAITRLIGELLQQLFLGLRHGSSLGPADDDDAERLALAQHRHTQHAAPAHGRGKPLIVVRIGQRVLQSDHRPGEDGSSGYLGRVRAASGTWPEAAPHSPGPRCGWRRNGAARHRSGTRSQTGFRRERQRCARSSRTPAARRSARC